MRRALVLFAAALGGPVLAQDGPVELSADLDGNGVPEVYRLHYEGGESPKRSVFADLTVETAEGIRRVERITTSGGMHGTYPWLEAGPEGTVLVHSQNEAYGQERWYLTLEIGVVGGEWRVTGIDYAWRDTLDLSARGGCTLDLVSGRGVVEGPRGEREVASPLASPTLWAWDEKHLGLPPDVCWEEDES